uniref:Uncharacterized protein n=1 Tax=Enterovibrio norvegicus TaxID=188144 RepID=A0A0H4A0T5_9GAMM|nr:hypothetical protein [Enterovibrio norvegicus]
MSIFESDYTPQEIELIKEFYPIRTARDIGFFLVVLRELLSARHVD